MRIPDALRPLADSARAAGWRVERTAANHLAFVCPEGRRYFTSGNPSDWRAYLNFRALLRRAGLRC